jgi:hypothetical protein
MAQDHGTWSLQVLGLKRPAFPRINTEQRENTLGRRNRQHALRAAPPAQRLAREGPGQGFKLYEAAAGALPFRKVPVIVEHLRSAHMSDLSPPDDRQAIGILVGQRSKEDGIDDAEVAVLAPIPIPSVRVTKAVKAGFRANIRNP